MKTPALQHNLRPFNPAVSVFALTSLDTGTRLGRFLFSELFLRENEKSWKDATGVRRFLAHPMVGTTFLVVIGCILGGLSLSQIWGLFGAANQLLAGIALMAVCAWLGQAGKNNKMFYVPMVFMLAATLSSLLITVKKKLVMIGAGEASGATGSSFSSPQPWRSWRSSW